MEQENIGAHPSRAQLDTLPGAVVVEFGASWCGHCRAAKPLLAAALATRPEVRHLRIEDGPGRKLGRSFAVKLWPTLIFLADGKECARLVRPRDASELAAAFAALAAALPAP